VFGAEDFFSLFRGEALQLELGSANIFIVKINPEALLAFRVFAQIAEAVFLCASSDTVRSFFWYSNSPYFGEIFLSFLVIIYEHDITDTLLIFFFYFFEYQYAHT
jgi:hypothetical protein